MRRSVEVLPVALSDTERREHGAAIMLSVWNVRRDRRADVPRLMAGPGERAHLGRLIDVSCVTVTSGSR
jgi:hypothetical protein